MIPDSIQLTWRSSDGRYTLKIGKKCIRRMMGMARKYYPNEVGTSLVGWYSSDQYTATVTDIAPMPPDSRGSRLSFHRGVRGTREFFSSLFRKTRGKRHYVGEWHSHPGGSPIASRADDINQSAIAADRSTDCRECILLILGGDFQSQTELQAYVYSRTRGKTVMKILTE